MSNESIGGTIASCGARRRRTREPSTGCSKLEGHSGAVYAAVFSPDGQRIITASDDGTASIFRIVTLDNINHLPA